ncbi:COP9 signalosome, subunit CSN7 [Phaffia rhodozyma]|uniref:COP9 signalosome, subunit CSN7 n=1 Tax=Phaffia rhodozyma TaxID=264483 RepID=A0A0F7SJ07_PHARH|nr:COP9 signalosome, subunit CSN7 [Phaffia rhodozyma]
MESMIPIKLEPYVLLAKGSKGAATAKCIERATSAPGVYVFSELFNVPSVQQLKESSETEPSWKLLQLFAFGTWPEYQANKSIYPILLDAQATKLKHLTVVSLSKSNRTLPYTVLLSSLSLSSIRELEDLLIEAIFHGLVKGKMDQQKACFHVDDCIGRDVHPQQGIEKLRDELKQWAQTQARLIDELTTTITLAQSSANEHQSQLLSYQIARDEAVSTSMETIPDLLMQGRNSTGQGIRAGGDNDPVSETPGKGKTKKLNMSSQSGSSHQRKRNRA